MTVREAIQNVLDRVQAGERTPELYKLMQALCTKYDIFNHLRRVLPDDVYFLLDVDYCEYFRPGHKEEIMKSREERKRGENEKWKQETMKRLRRMSDEDLLKVSKHIAQTENLL